MALATGVMTGCPTPAQPEKSRTRVELAVDLLQKGQFAAAETEIKKAEALDHGNEEAWNVHGTIYVAGRAAEASRALEIDNCVDGPEAEQLRKQVDEHMRTGDAKYKKALELASDYGDVWMHRGIVALHFSDWDGALVFLEKALANTGRLKSEAQTRVYLARAHYEKGEYVQAATEILQANQAEPNLCLGAFWAAKVFFKQQKFEDAGQWVGLYAPDGLCGKTPVLEALYLGGHIERSLGTGDGTTWFQRCADAAPRSCMARTCSKAAYQSSGQASP